MIGSLKKDFYLLAALFLLCAVLFGFKLGSFGLLDPDEPFYALTAKEMLMRHDPSTPVLFGRPQFEKPIFFYWVIYACFKLFGMTEWAARLGPCLAGILTVLLTYLWGRVLFKRRQPAFISAVVLATALMFVILSRIVLTDMFLCLFVTAALFCFTVGAGFPRPRGAETAPLQRNIAWIFFFIFCALGFLIKGPLGVLLPLFGIIAFIGSETKYLRGENYPSKGLDNASATGQYLTPRALSRSEFASAGQTNVPLRDNSCRADIPWIWGVFIFLLIAAPWYVLITQKYGFDGFLKHFFIHENVRRFFVSEHKSFDTIFFYPAAVWIGFFPWSAFVPGALLYGWRQMIRRGARLLDGQAINCAPTQTQKTFSFLFLTFVFIFFFFGFAKSKLLSYILPAFPIEALLIGGWFYRAERVLGSPGGCVKLPLKILCFIFFILFTPISVLAVGFLNVKDDMGIFWPVLTIAASLIPIYGAAYFYFINKKAANTVAWIVAAAVIFSSVAFGWLLPAVDGFFSTKYEGAVYKKEAGGGCGLILAGKLFVRGAAYYTGNQNVGVLTDNPKGIFYTKHPVPMFSTTEELLRIPASQFPVHCFLRPKEMRFLQSLVSDHFSITVIQQNAERIFVRLERR